MILSIFCDLLACLVIVLLFFSEQLWFLQIFRDFVDLLVIFLWCFNKQIWFFGILHDCLALLVMFFRLFSEQILFLHICRNVLACFDNVYRFLLSVLQPRVIFDNNYIYTATYVPHTIHTLYVIYMYPYFSNLIFLGFEAPLARKIWDFRVFFFFTWAKMNGFLRYFTFKKRI